jgi:Rps23 Pro-64 3,4-dihydroxylase Tpa1-like proline 4-hydroxylase
MNSILNISSIDKQIKAFGKSGPFDHVVIDNFFQDEFARELACEFPSFDSEVWHQYDNPIEIKKACNNWNLFDKKTYQAFSLLCSADFLSYLSRQIFNGQALHSDPGLNGGGWHIHKQGGKLNTHLDYSLHPKTQLQRKFNIIIYMNPKWIPSWGGALGFWDNKSTEKPGDLQKSVDCIFNRAVIFDTTQNSWHGLPEPVTCPDTETRKSIAVYYLCDPQDDVDDRSKALFAPTKDQENNAEILDLIKKRASATSASSVYKKK